MRNIVAVLVIAVLSGCATGQSQSSTEYRAQSARLYVEDANGRRVLPNGRPVVDIDHAFGVVDGAVSLLPGSHLVSHACPTLPEGVLGMHGAPSVWYKFEAGQDYVLRCRDGYVAIMPLNQ